MKRLVEYIKDTAAFFVAFVFQYPTKRFKRVSGTEFQKSNLYQFDKVITLETVSRTSGKVKFRGVIWNAILDTDDRSASIEAGREESIKEIKGNEIVVSFQNNMRE